MLDCLSIWGWLQSALVQGTSSPGAALERMLSTQGSAPALSTVRRRCGISPGRNREDPQKQAHSFMKICVEQRHHFKSVKENGLLETTLELGYGMVVQAYNPSNWEDCEFKAHMVYLMSSWVKKKTEWGLGGSSGAALEGTTVPLSVKKQPTRRPHEGLLKWIQELDRKVCILKG